MLKHIQHGAAERITLRQKQLVNVVDHKSLLETLKLRTYIINMKHTDGM